MLNGTSGKRFLGLLVGFMVIGSAFVFAEMPREKGPGRGGEMKRETGARGERGEEVGNVKRYLKFRQELNLTDAQVESLEKLRSDYKRDAIKKQADLKIVRMDLMEIIRREKPDFAAARAKVKQISALQLDSKLAMIDAMEKGFNVLTKEQQDKLQQLKKERKEDWKKKKAGE